METAAMATIHLGPGVSVDGYFMPDGTVRYGLKYISLLLGFAENYYSRILGKRNTKSASKKTKALVLKGLAAYQKRVKASHLNGNGASVAHTVSYEDFCIIVEHEAEVGNPKALALLTASFRELLRGRSQVAFGLAEDSLEEKQSVFQLNHDHYLEDKSDLEAQWLPGDELYYPPHRDWEEIEPWITQRQKLA